MHSYRFAYDVSTAGTAGGATIALSGSNNGGGQRAAADELLSYARPGVRSSTLPAGTTQYSMMIFYKAGLNAGSFTATLNGVNVASLFHPNGGTGETILIPLVSGRNVLKLSATGTVGGKSASDADQLVFKVP